MAMDPRSTDDGPDPVPMSDINVTPMVDVMLVLLIIFMVAAPMMMVGVPVQLPRTAAAKVARTTPPIIISVTRDGRIFLRQEEIGESEIGTRLAALRNADADDAPVYVRGDRAVPYGDVMRVMGRISAAGIERVSLIAESDPGAPALQAR